MPWSSLTALDRAVVTDRRADGQGQADRREEACVPCKVTAFPSVSRALSQACHTAILHSSDGTQGEDTAARFGPG